MKRSSQEIVHSHMQACTRHTQRTLKDSVHTRIRAAPRTSKNIMSAPCLLWMMVRGWRARPCAVADGSASSGSPSRVAAENLHRHASWPAGAKVGPVGQPECERAKARVEARVQASVHNDEG